MLESVEPPVLKLSQTIFINFKKNIIIILDIVNDVTYKREYFRMIFLVLWATGMSF
jgi:hypothetical protein